jgi:hypothetical protein
MHIRTVPVVPRVLFERVDDDWHEYGRVSGVATQWHVLGPVDGSEYWVVPDFNGPRGAQQSTWPCFVVRATTIGDRAQQSDRRAIRMAYSTAACEAALGIANALALEQVCIEF